MMIGPEPIMRILEMSVRLGMSKRICGDSCLVGGFGARFDLDYVLRTLITCGVIFRVIPKRDWHFHACPLHNQPKLPWGQGSKIEISLGTNAHFSKQLRVIAAGQVFCLCSIQGYSRSFNWKIFWLG